MKKIGIIGAMELEVETLKEHMSAANITKKANMEFYEGTLNGADVRCYPLRLSARGSTTAWLP